MDAKANGRTLILLGTLWSGSDLAVAETIRLKNGTVLHGSIVQMSETDVVIDTADMGQITVKRRAVQGFEDSPAPPAAAPAAPTPPGAISINNNNNNNNAATTTPAPVPVPVPAPAPAPAPAPLPDSAPPSPSLAATTDTTHPGLVLGSLGAGVGYTRLRYGEEWTDWARPSALVHWDILGYRGAGGGSVTVFGQGVQEQRVSAEWDFSWLMGGVRFDQTLLPHATRSGTGTFVAGLGAAYASLQMKGTVMTHDPWAYMSYRTGLQARQDGVMGVGRLGYQFLSHGGFGIGLDVLAGLGKLDPSRSLDGGGGTSVQLSPAWMQTAGVTLSAAYAL